MLKILEVRKAPSGNKPKVVDPRQVLLDAVRLLVGSGPNLERAAKTLESNMSQVRQHDQPALARLLRWFERVSRRKPDPVVFGVSYFDSASGTNKSEQVDHTRVIAVARARIALFSGLRDGEGSQFQRLSQGPENQVYDLINKTLKELQVLHRRVSGLNEAIVESAPASMRADLQGVKLDMEALKNAIVRANQSATTTSRTRKRQLS